MSGDFNLPPHKPEVSTLTLLPSMMADKQPPVYIEYIYSLWEKSGIFQQILQFQQTSVTIIVT